MISSKTAQLGVIILGGDVLRQLGLSCPRVVSDAARRLGVSRKAGYEAAERIRRELSAPRETSERGEIERENALLEIRVQILVYERDHAGVLFSERGRHLPVEAKSLSVRLLRDFRDRLSDDEIAGAIGVAPSSLRRWDMEADERCQFPQKDDRRGKGRHHRWEDERRVLEVWGKLEEPTAISTFAADYKLEHPERPLDPKTIGRILRKHGLKPLEVKERSGPYRDRVEIYFPGAQASLDATECEVRFSGEEHGETVKLKEEVAIDLATGAILGTALRNEEDAEGVERVVVQARAECEKLLAVLADNGSANTSSAVKRVVGEETDVGSIFSFPAHPQTNGHVEGLFSQFKRIAGTLEIDDRSRETIARSVVGIVWRIYSYFHNYSPRKRLNGCSPIEYLRRYTPLPEEVEAARRGLRKRKERSEGLREPNPRLHDEEFRRLVEHTAQEHRFDVDCERAQRSLVPYDTQVIVSSSRAFMVASSRDGFDERKRTFAYFMGIVRNKQREVDEAKLTERVGRDRAREVIERDRRYERALERERTEEARDLRERPERVVLSSAKLLLSGGLDLMAKTFKGKLREALGQLDRLGRNTQREIERLTLEIRSWGEYPEDLKRHVVDLIERESRTLSEHARLLRGVPS